MTATTSSIPRSRRDVLGMVQALMATAAVAASVWIWVAASDAIIHGHPAYGVWLALTFVGGAVAVAPMLRRRAHTRRVLRIVLLALCLAWIALTVWLRPSGVGPAALAAMYSDGAVTVSETPTQIELAPRGHVSSTAVFFQPGALVDARAYAAVLRPLAEDGYPVVVAKQPFGIAFLALGAFDSARRAIPAAAGWVVGGHSLGGTVAAIQAESAQNDARGAARGLLLYASYPASNMSESLQIPVMSISGDRYGLSTPDKIAASRSTLPTGTEFVVIDGAVHAQFGDYGVQPGDGSPTITDGRAREQIDAASLRFLKRIDDSEERER
jgi:hypothetical protein